MKKISKPEKEKNKWAKVSDHLNSQNEVLRKMLSKLTKGAKQPNSDKQ